MLNYDEFLTDTTLNRKYSAIRAMQKYMNQPDMVNLGGGLPNPECFPVQKVTITLKDGSVLQVSPKDLNVGMQVSTFSPNLVWPDKGQSRIAAISHKLAAKSTFSAWRV